MHHLQKLDRLVTQPSPAHLVELFLLVLAVYVGLRIVVKMSVTALFSLGCVLEVFSGNWKYIPIPLPLDRVAMLIATVALILRSAKAVSERRIRLQPIHFLLLAITTYTVASALNAGTLTTSYGFYTLLDRLGIIPFLLFTLAPLVFDTATKRDVLLGFIVGLGLYLGFTAVCEGVGLHQLALPHYINNDNLGINSGRARGPFLASDALGLSLFDCAVLAAIALSRWRKPSARLACIAVIAMAGPGIFFTLTRSVWIGGVLGGIAAALCVPKLRKWIPLAAVGAAGAIFVGIETVPNLSNSVHGRVSQVSSIWDRYNTNYAALRAVKAHPLFGIGWQTFETKGAGYLRESMGYPLTGAGLEVHNVFLSHFAELGIIGGLLWILALLSGVGGALLRKGPEELRPWRIGLLGIFCMFLVVANLAPLSYPLPNLILWMTAGIVAIDRNSTPRWGGAPEPVGADELLLSDELLQGDLLDDDLGIEAEPQLASTVSS